MKYQIILLTIIILFVNRFCHAQNASEWGNQKKTQRKYLMQQIAALQVYISHLQKGYAIAKDGLTFISDLKDGEFSMHKDYFNSLKKVNSIVRKYARISDIIALQKEILQTYHRNYTQVQKSDVFNKAELDYINDVYARLLADCNSTLNDLIAITTDDNFEMKDSQRLDRIDLLYAAMLDQYTFINSFGNETKIMVASRIKVKADIETSGILHGIK